MILMLAGDGIGSEVIFESRRVIHVLNSRFELGVQFEQGLLGGASIDAYGVPLTDEVLEKAPRVWDLIDVAPMTGR
jgi:3-isopropylmalate dehydrogenase